MVGIEILESQLKFTWTAAINVPLSILVKNLVLKFCSCFSTLMWALLFSNFVTIFNSLISCGAHYSKTPQVFYK
jgi:hypothetical protein